MPSENSQISILNQPFPLLDEHRNRWLFVLCSGVFGSIFVNVYNPMGIEQYLINSHIGQFLPIQFAGIVGAGTLSLTQFLLRRILGFERLTVIRFVCWAIFELVMISFVLFIFYGERGRPFWGELLLTMEKTFLLATVPYVMALLTVNLLSKRKSNDRPSVDSVGLPSLISIADEKGKPVLSLNPSDILTLTAEDNYVALSYLNNEVIERKLIRNNLKNLEKDLEDFPIKRIHRSYMINLSHVISIDRKSGKTRIKLAHLKDDVFGVSSTYQSNISTLLQ